MANPNVVGVQTVRGKTTVRTFVKKTPTTFLVNNANSGEVLKINSLYVANKSTSSVNVTVQMIGLSTQNVSQNVVDSITVASGSSIVLVSKNTDLYLTENTSLSMTATQNDVVSLVCSYEQISDGTPADRNDNVVETATTIVTTNLSVNLDAGNTSSYPGTGTTWFDLSGNEINGTLVNGVGYSSTNQGILVFDGSNDHVVMSANSVFNFGTGDVTIGAWIYWDGTYVNTGREIYATGGSGSLDQFGIFSGYGLIFGNIFNNVSANYPPINSWSYVCASKTGTNIKIYINGVETASGTQASAIGSSSVPAYIGIRGADNQHPFKGNIAAFHLYKGKGLTQEEIINNYDVLRSRYGL